MIEALRSRLDAYRLFLVVQGVFLFLLALVHTTVVLYRVEEAGLNPLEIVLVGTVLEVTYLVFEIPTGMLADAVSRRRCVIFGFTVLGLGFAFEGLHPTLAVILLAQVVSAFGFAFVGGALQAWVADEVPAAQLNHTFMRGAQVGQFGTLAGALLSGVVATIWIRLPFFIAGVLFAALAVLLVVFMRETGFRGRGLRAREDSLLKSIPAEARTTARMTRRLLRVQPVLIVVLLTSLFFGLSSEGWDRLSQVHLVESFTFPELAGMSPAMWLSLIGVVGTLLGIAVTEVVRRRIRNGEDDRPKAPIALLSGLSLAVAAAIAVFGLVGGLWAAVIAYLVAQSLRSAVSPVLTAWLLSQVKPRLRATALSVAGVFDSMGQVVGGPAVGVVGRYSLRLAIVATGLALLPVLLLLGIGRRLLRTGTAGDPAAEPVKVAADQNA